MCGVCGGDNSTCVPSNEVTGTFEIPNLSQGRIEEIRKKMY